MLVFGMVNNLPTLLLLVRTWAFLLLYALTASTALAHPGHEGHEDGDGFVWTSDHLAKHPWVTLLWLTAAALVIGFIVRRAGAKQRQAKACAAGTPAEGTLS